MTVLEGFGEEELAELIALGSAQANAIGLYFDEAAIENLAFGGEGHTDQRIWGGWSERDGEVPLRLWLRNWSWRCLRYNRSDDSFWWDDRRWGLNRDGFWGNDGNLSSGFRCTFFPDVLGGRVDGFDKGDEPFVHRTSFNGQKSDTGAEGDKKTSEGVFEKERQGKAVGDEPQNNSAGEPDELLDGHFADEAEFVTGDVLGNGVLFDGHNCNSV